MSMNTLGWRRALRGLGVIVFLLGANRLLSAFFWNADEGINLQDILFGVLMMYGGLELSALKEAGRVTVLVLLIISLAEILVGGSVVLIRGEYGSIEILGRSYPVASPIAFLLILGIAAAVPLMLALLLHRARKMSVFQGKEQQEPSPDG